MTRYTPEYEAMLCRWYRSLALPAVSGVIGLYLFSSWGVKNAPTLPASLGSLQGIVDVLPLVFWIGGIGGAIIQSFRFHRCPACDARIERGNKGACRSCGVSFGYES